VLCPFPEIFEIFGFFLRDKGVNKSKVVIFHQFCQKRPVYRFLPSVGFVGFQSLSPSNTMTIAIIVVTAQPAIFTLTGFQRCVSPCAYLSVCLSAVPHNI